MAGVPTANKLQFVPFPEIDPEAVESAIARIVKRRQQKRPSYGGYIVRAGGFAVAERAILSFSGLVFGDPDYMLVSFTGETENLLHTDEATPNHLTAHVTDVGRAEGIVLTGCPDAEYVNEYSTADEGRRLFDAGMYPYQTPEQAYVAELGVNDVLLFDSSQVHVFRSTTPDRISTGLVTH